MMKWNVVVSRLWEGFCFVPTVLQQFHHGFVSFSEFGFVPTRVRFCAVKSWVFFESWFETTLVPLHACTPATHIFTKTGESYTNMTFVLGWSLDEEFLPINYEIELLIFITIFICNKNDSVFIHISIICNLHCILVTSFPYICSTSINIILIGNTILLSRDKLKLE